MFGIDYNVGGKEREVANTIKARYDAGVTNFKQDGTAVAVVIDDLYAKREARVYEEEAPTLRAQSRGNQPEVVIPVLAPDRAEKRQNGRRFKENGEESFTLTAQGSTQCGGRC